jgi:hypothetical protein
MLEINGLELPYAVSKSFGLYITLANPYCVRDLSISLD